MKEGGSGDVGVRETVGERNCHWDVMYERRTEKEDKNSVIKDNALELKQ